MAASIRPWQGERRTTLSLADSYDRFYRSSGAKEDFADPVLTRWPRDRTEAILHSVARAGTVLDIGCGNGRLLHALRNRFDTLVGLEYSPERLTQARVNLEGLRFVAHQGSAENMSELATDSIDCIVSADTIEHIPDVYAATAEMARVLKPGGQLVINTPNVAFIKKRTLLLLGRFPSTSQNNEGLGSDLLFDGGHLHYFTYRSLRLLLTRAGFEIEHSIGFGRFGRVHNAWPPLLSGGVQLTAAKPSRGC